MSYYNHEIIIDQANTIVTLSDKIQELGTSVNILLKQRNMSGVILDYALGGRKHPQESISGRYDAVRQLVNEHNNF